MTRTLQPSPRTCVSPSASVDASPCQALTALFQSWDYEQSINRTSHQYSNNGASERKQMIKQPNMKRWSDEKLRMELAFSGPADDGGDECGRWNVALETEAERRGWIECVPHFAPRLSTDGSLTG